MRSFEGISWVAIGVIVVTLVAGILSFPVWNQNQFVSLSRERISLSRQVHQLESEAFQMDLELRRLESRNRIESIAQNKLSLGYFGEPIEIWGVKID